MTPDWVVFNSISFVYLLQHYVQAPEARPVPDGRAPSGLQQEQQQSSQPPQQREKQQQQQQQGLCCATEIGGKSLQKSLNPQQQKQTQTQSRKMASGVDIPYDISWVFPRLRNPSTLWYLASQIVITLVGILSKIVLGEFASHRDLYRSLYTSIVPT